MHWIESALCGRCRHVGDLLKSKVLERAASSSDALKEWIEFNCKFPNTYLDRMSAATDKTVRNDGK